MTLRFSYPPFVSCCLCLLAILLLACGESTKETSSDPPIFESPDTMDVVPLRVDTAGLDLDSTLEVVTTDDGKGDGDVQPCNEEQKKEIESRRKAIAELQGDIKAEQDADIASAMKEELADSEKDLAATLERFGCDG